MFGYVKPRHTELLVREYDFYRAAYCGVCRSMRKKTGFLSSFALSYDMVFLALCRMLTTDRHVACRRRRCIAHPLRRRPCLSENPALDYAARAGAVLVCEKLEDDKRDSSFLGRLRAALTLPVFRRAAKRARLSFLRQETESCLSELHTLEDERTPSIDAPAAVFGDLLGLIFAEELEGETASLFYDIGYRLGVFIYAADAADDYADDLKSGNYNPYVLLYPPEAFEKGTPEEVKISLRLSLSSLAEAVEKLPFGKDAALESIIKNTVYLGLPDRVEALGVPKKKQKKKEFIEASHARDGGTDD